MGNKSSSTTGKDNIDFTSSAKNDNTKYGGADNLEAPIEEPLLTKLKCQGIDLSTHLYAEKSTWRSLYKDYKGGVKGLTEVLLDYGADINTTDETQHTLLHQACENGDVSVIKTLIENGVDFNIKAKPFGNAPLHDACATGREGIVKMMIDGGADLNIQNDSGATALHIALGQGYVYMVKMLIEGGADLNIQKRVDRKTPLYVACEQGRSNLVKTLIDNGADPNITDRCGYTPLYWASSVGDESMGKVLTEGGADLEISDTIFHKTPLIITSEMGHHHMAKFLIESGADVDVMDQSGYSPLHYACDRGYLNIMQELILAGADTQSRDPLGRLPFELLTSDDDEYRTTFEEAVKEQESRADSIPILK
jgi:ankyrin repeat protein